jgi:hypothetical protein
LAIAGKSFRSLARAVFPRGDPRKLVVLALVQALVLGGSACGGSGERSAAPQVQTVSGPGYHFEAPAGWRIVRSGRSTQARSGAELVSVTIFPLARPYEPALWPKVVPELDRVARELAARESGRLAGARTEEIAEGKARVYDIVRDGADERIAFVLDGRREYQLFCRSPADACDRLLASFSLD